MTLSLKQLVRRGFTTRQAQALIENTPEVKAFPEHFANPTGDVAGLVSVLPKVASYPAGGGFEQADYYAGLVTVPAGAVPEAVLLPNTHLRYGWYLTTSDTPMTLDGVVNFAGYGGGQEHPAGAYLAIYITVPDADGGSVPTALPDGWTAGNTTGLGPVLPYLGEEDGYSLWGGLVYAEAGAVRPPNGPGNSGWALMDPAMPLAYDAINNDGISLGWGLPGVYLATYFNSPQTPAVPIALPAGLTFQPYGVGAAGPVLAALGEAVKSKVSYLAVDGGTISSGVNDDVVNLHAGNLRESGGTGLVLGTDGKITVVEESLVSVTAQILPVAHTGGTLVELNFTDTDSPTWGPAVRLAATGGGIVSLSSTYRFPAGDQIWIELSTDGTFSTTEVPGRFWITATPV